MRERQEWRTAEGVLRQLQNPGRPSLFHRLEVRETALEFVNELRYFPVCSTNEKRRTPCRGNAIEFAGDDETFKLGVQAHQMNIGDRQGFSQRLSRLIRM